MEERRGAPSYGLPQSSSQWDTMYSQPKPFVLTAPPQAFLLNHQAYVKDASAPCAGASREAADPTASSSKP